MPGLHCIWSSDGHALSLCIPGLYRIQGTDRIKMADNPDVKTARKAVGRTTLLPMKYTYVTFYFYNVNATVSLRNMHPVYI